MSNIQFDPNAGGAQGPRETIAGHTFNAGQSSAIHECQKKIEGLVKERNTAVEHMPDRALQINDELDQFIDTEVQGKLAKAGLNPKEIKDVIKHLEDTTGCAEFPAGLNKMDSMETGKRAEPTLSELSPEKAAVMKGIEQIIESEAKDIRSQVEKCSSLDEKRATFLENRPRLHKADNFMYIKVQLNNQDVKLNQKETQIVESYFKALVNRLDKEIAQLCRL
jgi:uncharacterized pyridoxal phosphate-containing UPF0001 family protein